VVRNAAAALSAAAAEGLQARGVGVSAGERRLVEDLSIQFGAGEFVAVLGRNGSGKTLTLHTLAGLRPPATGSVWFHGRPIEEPRRRVIARSLGLLAQDREEGLTTTVIESVLIGRHPHLSLLQWESAADHHIAERALQRVELVGFTDRSTDTLSGGEQRRAAIAALLTQEPQFYLLDEPTNHLDPHHQIAVLGLFAQLARAGNTIIASLHDPTLAARFATQALLLHGDGRWSAGPVERELTARALGELYLTPIVELESHGHRVFVSG